MTTTRNAQAKSFELLPIATVAVQRDTLTRLQNACRARGVPVSQVIEGSLATAADNLEYVGNMADEPELIGA